MPNLRGSRLRLHHSQKCFGICYSGLKGATNCEEKNASAAAQRFDRFLDHGIQLSYTAIIYFLRACFPEGYRWAQGRYSEAMPIP
jgi:hypothetical protein